MPWMTSIKRAQGGFCGIFAGVLKLFIETRKVTGFVHVHITGWAVAVSCHPGCMGFGTLPNGTCKPSETNHKSIFNRIYLLPRFFIFGKSDY